MILIYNNNRTCHTIIMYLLVKCPFIKYMLTDSIYVSSWLRKFVSSKMTLLYINEIRGQKIIVSHYLILTLLAKLAFMPVFSPPYLCISYCTGRAYKRHQLSMSYTWQGSLLPYSCIWSMLYETSFCVSHVDCVVPFYVWALVPGFVLSIMESQ